MKTIVFSPIFLVACLIFSPWLMPSALAFDWHFSGFGTAGFSCFTNRKADYMVNLQPEGPGRSGTCDAGLDSIIGGQVDMALMEGLEIGVQGTAEREAQEGFELVLSVAQLRWKPLDGLTLRFGRSPTPALLYSESRRIRYAMPWVRPPREVYSLVSALQGDGVEVIYEHPWGGWRAEWQGGVTVYDMALSRAGTPQKTYLSGVNGFLNLMLQRPGWTLKAGYTHGRVTFTSKAAESIFGALENPLWFPDGSGAQLADALRLNDSPFHLLSIGARHERDDWLAVGEFAYITTENFIHDWFGFYVTLGRQLGAWMPYVTVGRRWTDSPYADPRAGALSPVVGLLLESGRSDSTAVALGLSREITDYATLKFQVDWIQPDQHSRGIYTHYAPNYDSTDPPGDFLFTLNLDFVF